MRSILVHPGAFVGVLAGILLACVFLSNGSPESASASGPPSPQAHSSQPETPRPDDLDLLRDEWLGGNGEPMETTNGVGARAE